MISLRLEQCRHFRRRRRMVLIQVSRRSVANGPPWNSLQVENDENIKRKQQKYTVRPPAVLPGKALTQA